VVLCMWSSAHCPGSVRVVLETVRVVLCVCQSIGPSVACTQMPAFFKAKNIAHDMDA